MDGELLDVLLSSSLKKNVLFRDELNKNLTIFASLF